MDRIDFSVISITAQKRTGCKILNYLLHAGNLQTFNVPIAGEYQLYSESGSVVSASVEVDGVMLTPPFKLTSGNKMVALHGGPDSAFLLPDGASDLTAEAWY